MSHEEERVNGVRTRSSSLAQSVCSPGPPEMPADPSGMTPAINHREYRDLLIRFGVIDREGKGLAQQAVIIRVLDSVYSGRNSQTLDVCLNGTQKVVSEPDLLRLVKVVTLVQIPAC